MRIFNRHFFLGLGAGVLITLLIAVGGSILLTRVFISAENLEKTVGAPTFPSIDVADYNWTLKTLDGRDFSMTDAKGRVVFLNWWATWCAPCLAETPSIQRLYEKVNDHNIVFVVASQEDTTTVSRFVKENGYTFPVYTLPADPPAMFKPEIVPTTFILSPDGKVAFKHVGFAKGSSPVKRVGIDF